MPSQSENQALSIKELIAEQNSLLKEQLRIENDRLKTNKDNLVAQQDVSNEVKSQLQSFKQQKAEKSAILRSTNSISKIQEDLSVLDRKELTNTKAINKLKNNQLKIDKDIRLLGITKKKILEDSKFLTKQQIEDAVILAGSIDEQVEKAIKLNKELKSTVNLSENLDKNFGTTSFNFLEDLTTKIPGLSALSKPFSTAADAARDMSSGIESAIMSGGEGLSKDRLKELGLDELTKSKTKVDKEGNAKQLTGTSAVSVLKGISPAEKSMLALKAGFKELGPIIKKAIPLFLVVEFLGALKASDKATGELAKSMNMSYSEANLMRQELNSIANLSGDVLINTKGLQESLMAVNAELGTSVMLNSENLKTYTLLREASGLTMEDQKGLVSLTNATKGNAEDITKELLGAARASATKNKSVLNEKTLLKDISNISAATTLSFGKDAGLIGETVATVKALGMEMSKVDAIASSLLDFESSIENELQAELLLNKDINLEKARQAALNNDFKTVAEEIAKQAGNSAEFAAMNRIQQDALAKAVGMNREELAKTLFVQEQIGNVSEEEANLREQRINKLQAEGLSNEQIKKKLGEESFESLKNQASVQERLNKSVEKLRELFISIADPVMQLISPIVDLLIPAVGALGIVFNGIGGTIRYIVDSVNGIVGVFTGANEQLSIMQTIVGSIAIGYASILAIQKIKAGWDALSLIMEKRKANAQKKGLLGLISEMAMKAFNALGGIPVIGPALGIAAAIAAATLGYSYYNKAGDINSPADGKTQISTKEGGLFELSSNDDIIAAPGASKAMAKAAQGGGNAPMVVQQNNEQTAKTNDLLGEMVKYIKTQPQLSAVGLYEVQ